MKTTNKLIILGILVIGLAFISTACKSDKKESTGDDTTTKETGITPTIKPENPTAAADSSVESELSIGDNDYTLVINGSDSYDISDLLYGLFLEDINYAVDGGLYAEMIKNRSFEFGSLAMNKEFHGWSILGDATYSIIDGSSDASSLNESNPHYLELTNASGSLSGIGNDGFLDGLSVEENAIYDFSGYFKGKYGYTGSVTLQLRDAEGTIYGESTLSDIKNEWWKYEAEIKATATVSSGLKFYVLLEDGTLDMDMLSLFPQNTYKGRENGLRLDIANSLEGLTPKFLRFPGGCVVEGESLHNAYNWKDSIGNGLAFTINGKVTYGDVAIRPLAENIWGNQNAASRHPYYMTYGLGFYEYFLLCEDLGAQPVPILNAGLSCLIQGTRSVGTPSESTEIGSPEFNQYVQDALDLVEFCKGDSTTTWGAIRIAMGHEEPFDLTYIGIGNEQWGNVYFSRYDAFKAAFEQAAVDNPALYKDIKLIVANGPVAGDRYAWNKIKLFGADYAGLVDEHYYMIPSWFLTNTTRYDSYDRTSTQVFLGEYAARSNNAEAALAEAAYMTGLERNGDIVKLASYAPLFGNTTSTQWTPDMIWFKNNAVWGSPNYYVQKIFSNNKSTKILKSTLTGNSLTGSTLSGKVGIGTWMTAATFDNIKVTNNDTGEVLLTDDFSTDSLSGYTQMEGKWSIENGQMVQANTGNPLNGITGDVAYIGDETWTNYTLTLTATKTSGNEGFLIPIAVKDQDNYFHWNIGGWNNTVSCLEQISSGVKSGQITETLQDFKVETGKAYEIKIVVSDNDIECYLDGKGLVDYHISQAEAVYEVTGTDDSGGMILKIVNVSGDPKDILIKADNIEIPKGLAKVFLLAAESLTDMNNAAQADKVSIKESTIEVSKEFVYSAPKYSVTVIRIPTAK